MISEAAMPHDERAAKRQKNLSGVPTAPPTPLTSTYPPVLRASAAPPTPVTPFPPSSAPKVAAPAMCVAPEAVVDVCADGDAILVVKSIGDISTPVGIRVYSHALSATSPIFKRLFHMSAILSGEDPGNFDCLSDDGDALLLLCNALHLRNDKLPARLSSDLLRRFVSTAAKYECLIAASRSATPWFDHIYGKVPTVPLMQMIEAAYSLDDPVYFARFTTRWVLMNFIGAHVPESTSPEPRRKRLATELLARQRDGFKLLKADLDVAIEPLAEALSDAAKHHVDTPPSVDLEDDDEYCTGDKNGAVAVLGALRDKRLWPATNWSNSILSVIDAIGAFRVPVSSGEEQCSECVGSVQKAAQVFSLLKKMHIDRLWGLCLDCYKAGGRFEGECRFEHTKPPVMGPKRNQQTNGQVQQASDGAS